MTMDKDTVKELKGIVDELVQVLCGYDLPTLSPIDEDSPGSTLSSNHYLFRKLAITT